VRQSVLIVDDEELIRRSVRMALEGAGYSVTVSPSAADALRQVRDEPPDCVLIDLRLGDGDGLDVLRAARERTPDLKAIVITAHGDVDSAVHALRLGAFDFIKKPFDLDEVIASVKNALHTDALERQVAYYSGQMGDLIFESETMRAAMRLLDKVAAQPVPVILIAGETGTGKELAARALHRGSPRAKGPFIELNCSAIPESLIESELFGHERGAFSDAREQKRGLVELADGGTLFLDEIGDLPETAQAKLLKFVETREFRRVGGTKLLSVDCRVLAATHRHLEDGPTFRRDLYYRLAGITITLPPLRERGDDVLVLARRFLEQYARQYHKRLDGFTPEAEALLCSHRWPGNVRELKAAISSAAVMADEGAVGVESLGQVERGAVAALAALPQHPDGIMTIDELEMAYVTRVLQLCGGNKVLAAQRLGISRQTLARWIADPSDATSS
jgi:two-component system, NtrC family, response regulator AtoC